MFQQPSEGGDRTPWAELTGSLVLVYARELRTGISTTFGPKDAIEGDVHVLQGAHAGESYENTLIFGQVLIGSLKSACGGDPVLGRVGTGTSKPGQKPPYTLLPFTETDAAIATAWITARMTQVQQPPAAANPQTAAGAAASAPTPATATVPSTANGTTAVELSTLPPAVLELLKQAGQIPA